MSQQKRKVLNIEEKSHIIWRIENGETNVSIARELGLPHSMISTIWKNREKTQSLFQQNSLKIKRARSSDHKEIEEALLKWFTQQRTNNVPINGPILQAKANEFACRLGNPNFNCSSSWIQRFRACHDIVAGRICGEAASVPDGVTDEWLSKKWPVLCEGYKPDDIFNADETGLFYNMTPNKTLKFKGEQCSGGKMSKTRVTVMVAGNMTGFSKEKLLVIGKSRKPRCFKNIHSLPVVYENNAKSWMTSEIFEKWLRNWDSQLKSKKRKILLLIDNCPAHPVVDNLQYIKLVFLPPNVTSVLQPMDQGVIKSLKIQYRKLQVMNMLQKIEEGKEPNFNVLDAILMISEAWENVTQRTIANCFKHAGFRDLSSAFHGEGDTFSATADDNDVEDAISFARLLQELGPSSSTCEIEDFAEVDNHLAVCASASEQEIVADIQSKQVINENEQEEEQFVVPSLTEALSAVKTLQKFIMFKEEFYTNDNSEMLKRMHRQMQNAYAHLKCKKQTKITDYLK